MAAYAPGAVTLAADPSPRVAFATCSWLPDGFADDHPAAALLRAEFRVWDDPTVDWSAYDRVVVRSTWDYTPRRDAFLAWARGVGPALRNPVELLAYSSDKRYLQDLARDGIPTVPTEVLEPGERFEPPTGACVVKPAISAGARDTGRFPASGRDAARSLVADIHASGRAALVQPYLERVEVAGETSLVVLGGELSHVLRKGVVLRQEGRAPTAPDGDGPALVMLEPDLVVASSADEQERALARRVTRWLEGRFGAPPLYLRVDLLRGADGSPVVLELEGVEPALYLAAADGASERLVAAIRAS